MDIWDLKDGQDKYAFMEQCVTDPEIDRVLIICDKGYAEKADHCQGGVGDETTIISPEIYRNANGLSQESDVQGFVRGTF